MTGAFVQGVFVETPVTPVAIPDDQPSLDILGNAMLIGANKYFSKYQETKPCGVAWLQAPNGFMIMCTWDPKYALMMKQFVGRLK